MECAICYSEIKDHKLFKGCCCSINLCIDCVKIGKLKKCPQCKESYGWIGANNKEEIKEFKEKFEELNEDIEEYQTDICLLESKITKYKSELGKKDKCIDQLRNIIVQLIVEKEEEETEAELIEDFQDVVNRLNLIP